MLGNLWEHRALFPPVKLPSGRAAELGSVHHELMVLMSPDCDLLWDFELRFPDTEAQQVYQPVAGIENAGKFLPHVLLCDAFDGDQLRNAQGMNSGTWRDVKRNKDERYHLFAEAKVGDARASPLPSLCLDFKRVMTFPTPALYEGIRLHGIRRLAVVPPVHLHALMHRFYAFQSRVAVPDE